MKKLLIVTLVSVLALFTTPAYADRVELDSSETLSTPTATQLDWYIDKIDARTKSLVVKYRWLDASAVPIAIGERNNWLTWTCRNISDNPETVASECLGVGDPWDCCTGVGTGDCDETVTDFSDIFSFSIRSQDVGMSIGVGLRTLIWNEMKDDILTPGNDGTFIGE